MSTTPQTDTNTSCVVGGALALPTATDIIEVYLTQVKPHGIGMETGEFAEVDENTGRITAVCALGAYLYPKIDPSYVGVETDNAEASGYPYYVYDDSQFERAAGDIPSAFTRGVAAGFDGERDAEDIMYLEASSEQPLWRHGWSVGHAVREWALGTGVLKG